jgi:hypothetical protein
MGQGDKIFPAGDNGRPRKILLKNLQPDIFKYPLLKDTATDDMNHSIE